MGVAFVGQYLAKFLALSPGNEQKLPVLTAHSNVDLTGDPTVECRYSMRFFCGWQVICLAVVFGGSLRWAPSSGSSGGC